MKKFIIGIILLISTPELLQAKSFQTKTFSIELNDGWEDYQDLYGLPYVMLGPQKATKRSSIAIVPAEKNTINIAQDPDEQATQAFYDNRKKWVEENGGNFLKAYPFSKIQNSSVGSISVFGSKYKLGENVFEERSYYFHCGDVFFHVKSLTDEKDTDGSKDSEKIISSFRCKK